MLRRLPLLPAAAFLLVMGCSDDSEDTTGTGGAGTGGDATTSTGGMATSTGGMTTSTGGMGGDPGDTTPPTVAITDDASDAIATDAVTFTFTFSEDVGTSFAEADITLAGGGTASDFTVVDATTATIVVTPDRGTSGTMEVTVAAGTFEDAAGNTNTDAATAIQEYDVPPLTTVLFDMEGTPAPGMEPFGNLAATPVVDPTDATNMVAQLDKPGNAELWAGNTFHYCPNFGISVLPFAVGTTTIRARVWSPDANVPIRLKVEDASAPTISVETEAMVTTAATWEWLTFDLSMEASGTAAINYANTYDKLSIFPNFGTDGATAGAKTYYVDDIEFVGLEFTATCP